MLCMWFRGRKQILRWETEFTQNEKNERKAVIIAISISFYKIAMIYSVLLSLVIAQNAAMGTITENRLTSNHVW